MSVQTTGRAAVEITAAPPRLFFRTDALPADAVTRLGLEAPGGLARLVRGREDAVAWVREGRGLVGLGRVLAIEAGGPARIEQLRAAWRSVVYASWWRDALVRPGTGPVALGTIAFSAQSAAASTLVVPQVLLGLDEQGAWITCAGLAEADLPSPQRALDLIATALTAEPAALVPAQVLERPAARENYFAALARVQARMRAGEVEKVVIARDEVVIPGASLTAGDLVERLAQAYPSCWTFAVDGMVGASPELLVRVAGRRLTSRVLAGTARRRHPEGSPQAEAEVRERAAWLEASAKNNREHALARESALTALEPLCSVVEAPERFVLTLPNVLHLASDISGVVAGDTGALSLVGALHPTAAVGGTPRAAAAHAIAQDEGFDRGRYAGPVGWVDWHGEGEWCIALRSGQIETATAGDAGMRVRIFGGGGIMPDSEPEDEFAETRAKMQPMLAALGVK